jgi:hypothetical protein
MATLTGQNIANTYKQLLQVGSNNTGLTTSVQTIQDGSGTNSALQLSQSAVNINGTFQLNGSTLTATASALNAVPNITAYTGFIAVSGTNINGRTLVAGTGVSITNADGTEGNPNIFLNTTGVTSGTYGPATNFEVNAVGQVVSAGAATSVSVSAVTANTFTGGTFEGTTGNFSSNVSVGGDLTITGAFSPAVVSTSAVNATTGTFSSTVSAGFFYGDGSNLTNVPSAEGGTVKRIEAGQGIKITVDGAVSASIPVSGTVAVSANQNFGTVSVSTAFAVTGSAKFGVVSATEYYGDGANLTNLPVSVSAYTVNQLTIVSAATLAGTDLETRINTVSVNTSVNAAAITSINTVVDNLDFATSAELAIVSAYATSIVQALSATMATSIDNSNTNITTNANAITSINAVVAGVSVLTSINAAAITSINAIIEGDVSADSGTFNTLTVITSASVGGTFNVGGNVGIGTSNPSGPLHIVTSTATAHNRIYQTNSGGDAYNSDISASTTNRSWIYGAFDTAAGYSNGAWSIVDLTASATRLVINSSGNVGIGTTSPGSYKLNVNGNIGGPNAYFIIYPSPGVSAKRTLSLSNNANATLHLDHEGGYNRFGCDNASQHFAFCAGGSTAGDINVVFKGDGKVGIGTTSPSEKLSVVGNVTISTSTATTHNRIYQTNSGGDAYNSDISASTTNRSWIYGAFDTAAGFSNGGWCIYDATSATYRLVINSSGNVGIGTTAPTEKLSVVGNVTISGSITKGSGSFRIDHPIKPNTHHLVHSFVEAPTADNIYRGTVTLIGGMATVNLDTAARLTSGTFEALNTNVDCWVSNKSGWTAVRGNIEGAILTITAQDSNCTDTVSWLVIGERHDQTIIDANWTDANGRVITEPKKEKGVI